MDRDTAVNEVDIIRSKYLLPTTANDDEIVTVTLDEVKKISFQWLKDVKGFRLLNPVVLMEVSAVADCSCTKCKKITKQVVNGTVTKIKCTVCGTITEIKV
jgi:hypothetical protein